MSDVLGSEPRPRSYAVVLLAAAGVAVAALGVRQLVRAPVPSAQFTVTAARPVPAARPATRQVAVGSAEVVLRNDTGVGVDLREQRIDGDAEPGAGRLPAGASATVRVSWSVRCAEVGSLYGPQRLQLVLRRRGGVLVRRVDLGGPDAPVRRALRLSASDACAAAAR